MYSLQILDKGSQEASCGTHKAHNYQAAAARIVQQKIESTESQFARNYSRLILTFERIQLLKTTRVYTALRDKCR